MAKAKTAGERVRWDWHSKEGRVRLDAAVLAAVTETPEGRATIAGRLGIEKDDIHGLRAVTASVWRAIATSHTDIRWRGNGGQRVFWRESEGDAARNPRTRAVAK